MLLTPVYSVLPGDEEFAEYYSPPRAMVSGDLTDPQISLNEGLVELAGGEEGFKRRAPGGSDLEPTQGAGPCLEDTPFPGLEPGEVGELWTLLYNREYNVVDVLVLEKDGLTVYIRSLIDSYCLRPVELHVELCNDLSRKGLLLSDEPEVDKVILKKEGSVECVELVSGFNPVFKPVRLIEKLGITDPFNMLAYKPVS